jgi:putative ABC transport system permease protein
MILRLGVRMFREHRWSYAGLASVLVIASALVGVSLLISRAASASDPDRDRLTRNELALFLGRLENGAVVAQYLVILSIFLAAVLVFQVSSFMIDGRRQEIALLRLVGAARRQVILMLVAEAFVLAIVASVIGAVVAVGAAGPFAQLLALSNNWPAGLPVEVHVDALLLCPTLIAVSAVGGTCAAAFRVLRVPPVDAVGLANAAHKRRLPVARLVVAGAGVVGMGVALALPLESGSLVMLPSLVGGFAVVVASALAPFVVPVVGAPLAALLTRVAGGAAFVARKELRFDAHRAGVLATPIIVVLGLGSVFGMFAMTGRAANAAEHQVVRNVEAVVEVHQTGHLSGLFTETATLPEVSAITRLHSTKTWSWADGRIPENESLTLDAIDPTTFADFVPTRVLDGDIRMVAGSDVAVTTPTPFRAGDFFTIDSSDGVPHDVRVAAVVETTPVVKGNVLVDGQHFDLSDPESTQTWLVHAAGGVATSDLVLSLQEVLPSARVMTKDEWVTVQADRQLQSLGMAVVTIVGGGAVFAMVGLTLAVLAASRERKRMFEVLRAIGARTRSIVATMMIEAMIVCTAAVVMGGAVVVLVYVRMDSALAQAGVGIGPVVPFAVVFGVVAVSLVVAVSAAAAGTGLALRRLRRDMRSA